MRLPSFEVNNFMPGFAIDMKFKRMTEKKVKYDAPNILKF